MINELEGLFRRHLMSTSLVDRMSGAGYAHLARRANDWPAWPGPSEAFDAYAADGPGSPDKPQVSGAAFLTIFLTVLFGVLVIGLVQYPVKLLMTLTVVESPPAVYLPLDEEEASSAPESAPKPQPRLVRQGDNRVFITSSIRGTLSHLRRQGGFWAPWRGIVANIMFGLANSIVRGIFVSILAIALPLRIASILGGIASVVALSRFALTVTHIMISAPQPGSWWTRLNQTSWAQAKKTIPALVLFAVASQATFEFAIFSNNPEFGTGARIGIISSDLLAHILLVIPATILLVRVQASVMADDVPTIVPFDKTFGQDTTETNGVLTIKMALHSFDSDLLKRLGLFLLKTIPLVFSLTILLVVIVVIEIASIGISF